MRYQTKTLFSFIIIGITVTASLLFLPHAVFADDFDGSGNDSQEVYDRFQSYATILASHQYLDLTASVGKTSVQWSITSSSTHPYPGDINDILSPAVLTFDVYKGDIGSSTLVYSQTLPSSTSIPDIPYRFQDSGKYLLVYSATFPKGTYPLHRGPDDLCNNSGGDRCVVPEYSLTDFQTFMTQGLTLAVNNASYGAFVPAAFGILQETIEIPSSTPKVSNVLFLPGTMESRLYMKNGSGEQRVWEPSTEGDAEILAMNPDGTSKNTLYTRDIMDHLYSDTPFLATAVKIAAGENSVLYEPFERFMNDLVQKGTIHSWQSFPYDWRYDVRDIVRNGTLIGTATTTPTRIYLQQVVQELASSSPSGKVTIIAHSNGGLLAKALLLALQEEGKDQLIDHLIMVGTPQFGTPGAIGSLLHGDGQTRALGFVSYAGTVRDAGLTMPGPYDLLPSPAYFLNTVVPVITFANDALEKKYRAVYGNEIDTYKKLSSFLTNASGLRTQPPLIDLRTPAIALSQLVLKALKTHEAIDGWIPPPTLSVTSLVGWGENTINQYDYSSSSFTLSCSLSFTLMPNCTRVPVFTHSASSTKEGDDTVVSKSAAGNIGTILYLDTQKYERDTSTKIIHQNLLSAAPVQNQIADIIKNASAIEPYLQPSEPSDLKSPFTVVSVHSPVNIVATDSSGKQTGLVPVAALPGMYFIKEEIPGSSVQVLDDEKYLYLPDNSSTYHLSLQGYASGETTLEIGAVDTSGVTTTTQTFSGIPTTASTTATFTVTDTVSSPPAVDIDGDGTTDLIATTTTSNLELSTSTIRLLLRQRFAYFETHPLQKLRFLLRLLGFKDSRARYTPQDIYAYFMKLLDSRSITTPSNDESTILMQLLSSSSS